MIKLKQITKQFIGNGKKIRAVNKVDLEIHEGEIFGIIGYSGAGKSTLLRVINQLEKQTDGQVFIGNLEISSLSEKELRQQRQKIGMIFQHFNLLWSKTVEQNILLALEIAKVEKTVRKQRVQELIDLVGLSGREKAYPSELSGGQKQRVGIARALANNPSVLLCDEATSALDPETTESILELLASINKKLNLTIVMITHQMEVVQKVCHRVAVMSEGRVIELGQVEDLFKNPEHEVSKRFVQTLQGGSVAQTQNELKRYYPQGQLLRLVFTNQYSGHPILSQVLKNTPSEVNIVSANINHTQTGGVGVMYIHVEKENRELVHALEEKGVVVEIC